MKLSLIARRTAFEMKTKGALRGVRTIAGELLRHRKVLGTDYDEGHGVDTAGNIPIWELAVDSENAHLGEGYQPTKEANLRATLDALDIAAREGTFIDLGCGKALALLIAAEFGFKHLVGVEFAGELAAIGRRNLERKGIAGDILTMDAGQYQFPSTPFVLYLYNPFRGETFARMLDNLKRVSGQDFSLVYCNALETAQLRNCGFLRLEKTLATSPPTEIWLPR